MPAVPMVSSCVTGIELNRSLEFPLSEIPIPVVEIEAKCQRCVGFAERVVQFECFRRRRLGFWERLFRSHAAVLPVPQQGIGIRQPRVSLGVGWILFDGLVEVSNGLSQAIVSPLIPKVSSLEIGLMGFRVHSLLFFQRK